MRYLTIYYGLSRMHDPIRVSGESVRRSKSSLVSSEATGSRGQKEEVPARQEEGTAQEDRMARKWFLMQMADLPFVGCELRREEEHTFEKHLKCPLMGRGNMDKGVDILGYG